MDEEKSNSFAKLIGSVRHIEHDTVVLQKPPVRAISGKQREKSTPVETDLVVGSPDRGDETEYSRPGVQRAVLRKLKRGRFPIQGELDLHGLTLAQAKRRMSAFLEYMRGRQVSCLRIIHGKGHSSSGKNPVLRPNVRVWLSHHRDVLAYSEARGVDGGSGALYVLLRRR